MKFCDTCGRRPSERHPQSVSIVLAGACPDPIHDLADRCVYLKEAVIELREFRDAYKAERDALRADLQITAELLGRVRSFHTDKPESTLSHEEEMDALRAELAEAQARIEAFNKRPAILAMTEEWKAMEADLEETTNDRDDLLVALDGSCDTPGVRAELAEAVGLLNTPETEDFLKGVQIEAGHQRGRWGSEHDKNKTPEDWFWLLGFLAGKALRAQREGDHEKALHHLVSSAASLANQHRQAFLAKQEASHGPAPAKGGE